MSDESEEAVSSVSNCLSECLSASQYRISKGMHFYLNVMSLANMRKSFNYSFQ